MTDPKPYFYLHSAPLGKTSSPGTAGVHAALTFHSVVSGCQVQLHTFDEFNRTDGPADAIAHGCLAEGPVSLFAADVAGRRASVQLSGFEGDESN